MPDLESGTPRDIWKKFFAEQKPKPETVAEIVRRLHEDRRHEQAIACIETALVNSEPQPWMYEVLGLSMQLAKRPQVEIERVMLSRVDFTGTSLPDLLVSAAYLKRLGFDQRALGMYQQTARLAPTRPEPYILGLRIARELNDVTGVEWGTVGVLTNVWQPGYEAHHREAEDIASAVELSLRQSNRESDADLIKASVAAAKQRDLMLKLTWSGNADLDLSVEEPNGGVCSIENPFTEAGGAHTHDGYGPKAANCFEEYLCASGLPGDYLVRIQLASGEVVGKRAELQIKRYVGTPDETVKTMNVTIDGKDKVIRLSLNDGRRQALLDKQPADWNPAQPGQNRNGIMAVSGTTSRQFAGGAGAATNAGRGAIGFQPVIRTVPDGIGLSAMAVVTGDRRYVKMSLAPFFNQVIQVDSFTIPSNR